MKIATDMTKLIGNTPLVRLNRVIRGCCADVVAKLEYFNPMSTIKDRIAVSMIDAALRDGKIVKNTVVVEPTSGNTGIGLAFVCATRGILLKIFMPENFSRERRKIMKALGAEVALTPAAEGMLGAISASVKFCKENQDTFMPQQFENPANPQAHREATGPEIWEDTDGMVDVLVAGVGTGGTLTGAGEFLKRKKPGVKIVAVEPDESPVLSGGEKGAHIIQGIGAGFIPDVLNSEIIDEVIRIKGNETVSMQRRLSREEGIFSGLSSAAAVCASLKVAKREENSGKLIVVIIPDSGDKYLSSEWFMG
ncbi:MAG: cysteine synthase A [Candidatus Eremiobacteraeota bacterium]|nr:cysteine synthase A [Candidatus Eremiobacteraeota bacterium]